MPDCVICRHEHEAHQHWRAGTDCGVCGCPRYRAAMNPLDVLWVARAALAWLFGKETR